MLDQILTAFHSAVQDGAALDRPLQLLLDATGARAVGLWRCVGDALVAVGFRAVPEMPAAVSEGFAAATKVVPLSNFGLGIVKAAVTKQPAVAVCADNANELSDSASWLARFSARQSLAIPVFSGDRVAGVIAISTARELAPDDAAHLLLAQLADRLGPALAEKIRVREGIASGGRAC